LDIDSILDNRAKDQSLKILQQNIQSLKEQIMTIQNQRTRLVDALADGDTGLSAIKDRIRNLTKQEQDLIDAKELLTQEYDVESHRLGALTRSVDEIKRLTDQLDDNDVRIKLQTEVRRLVDKVVLHFKIKKFVIYYHKPKMVVKFKNGKSILLTDSDGDSNDDLNLVGLIGD
jgi:chromosome segregation ATPase